MDTKCPRHRLWIACQDRFNVPAVPLARLIKEGASAEFSPDGQYLATGTGGSRDNTAKLWVPAG